MLGNVLKQAGTAAGAFGALAATLGDSMERLETHNMQLQQAMQALSLTVQTNEEQIKVLILKVRDQEVEIERLKKGDAVGSA